MKHGKKGDTKYPAHMRNTMGSNDKGDRKLPDGSIQRTSKPIPMMHPLTSARKGPRRTAEDGDVGARAGRVQIHSSRPAYSKKK